MQYFIKIYLLIALFCNPSFCAGDKRALINETLSLIEVQSFLKSLEKIKSYKSVSHIKEMDYQMKKYYSNIKEWYFFDEKSYKENLISKINVSMSKDALSKVLKTAKNPFYVKVLKSLSIDRDIFNFHEQLLNEKYVNVVIPDSRLKLLNSLYDFLAYEIQKNNIDQRLNFLSESKALIVKILKAGKTDDVFLNPDMVSSRLNNSKSFILQFMANDLKGFKHYELREFMRLIKDDDVLQFTQLILNYHFLYVTKYVRSVETDKINQLKLLDITPSK